MALSNIAIAGIVLIVLVIIYFVYQNSEKKTGKNSKKNSFETQKTGGAKALGAAGSCWQPMCSPYNCNADASACLTSCTGPDDTTSCDPNGGICMASPGGGFQCGIPIDCGKCAPYLCNASGTGCETTCSAIADCISPATCVSGSCVPPSAGYPGQILNNCVLCPGGCKNSISADGAWAQCSYTLGAAGCVGEGDEMCPGTQPPPPPPPPSTPYPPQYIQRSTATGSLPGVPADQLATCSGIPVGQNVSWNDIALMWKTGGGAPEDCPAALIIAPGETTCTADGCINSANGGIWQVTSPNPPPSGCTDETTNICCNVDDLRTHLIDNANSGMTCGGNYAPGYENPNYMPVAYMGGGLGGIQPNYIGPFCQSSSYTCAPGDPDCKSSPQSGPDGCNWGGGSNWYGRGTGYWQLFPFPWYYYGKFLETTDTKCDMGAAGRLGNCYCPQLVPGEKPSQEVLDCYTNNIVAPAVANATQICNTAYATENSKQKNTANKTNTANKANKA